MEDGSCFQSCLGLEGSHIVGLIIAAFHIPDDPHIDHVCQSSSSQGFGARGFRRDGLFRLGPITDGPPRALIRGKEKHCRVEKSIRGPFGNLPTGLLVSRKSFPPPLPVIPTFLIPAALGCCGTSPLASLELVRLNSLSSRNPRRAHP
jgi:hypothetical protein